MSHEHGKTEEVSRGCNLGGIKIKPESLGTTRRSGEELGINSFFAGGKNWDERDIRGELTPIRDTTPGKILERLEALEAKHLDYVHSHQDRLKARLGESEEAENQFKQESNQIRSDIYHLVIAQEQNGDGSN